MRVNRPKNYTYGFLRLEIIVAFLNGLALIVISLGITYEGVMRIIHQNQSSGVMVVIVLGLLVNIILTLILVRSLKRRQYQYSECAMALHGDLLNSLGVIVAVVLIHFTGWEIIDPIISIIISLIIFNGGYKIIKMRGKCLWARSRRI